jgi:hypothetical protein
MISAQNVTLAHLGPDLRPDRPDPATLFEGIASKVALIRECQTENRSKHFATLTMIAAFTSGVDLTQFEPKESP